MKHLCLRALLVLALCCAAQAGGVASVVEVTAAGTKAWKIHNDKISMTVLPIGAVIHSLEVPDRDGKVGDVVLGFDSHTEYQVNAPYFGAIVGRVANRIARGIFTVDNRTYKVTCNNGENSLHGGASGFNKKMWKCSPIKGGVELSLRSLAGDEGYPGTLHVKVQYVLKGSSVEVTMSATCESPTPVNLAQHSYFNLAGHDKGSILGCQLELDAAGYMPTKADSIPTGEIIDVMGTEFDFSGPAIIGDRMNELAKSRGIPTPFDAASGRSIPFAAELGAAGGPQSGQPLGFDNNYVLRQGNFFSRILRKLRGGLRPVATVTDEASGRCMQVKSDAPGVQFYTGNYLDGVKGKGGATYKQHAGLCLETQSFPNTIGAKPSSPTGKGAVQILKPGETYKHTVVYTFSTVKGDKKCLK